MRRVQVGATDAAVAHAHEELAGLGFRARDLFDDETARFSQYRGAHRKPPRRVYRGPGRYTPARERVKHDTRRATPPQALVSARVEAPFRHGSSARLQHV